MSFGIGSDAMTVQCLHSFVKMLIRNEHLQSDGSHKKFQDINRWYVFGLQICIKCR